MLIAIVPRSMLSLNSLGGEPMLGQIKAWFKTHGWIAQLTMVFGSALFSSVVTLVAIFYYFADSLPDVKQELREVTAEVRAIRTDFRAASQAEREDLRIHIADERVSRSELGSALKTIQIVVASLKQKVEKRPLTDNELREIISKVNDVSSTEASGLVAVSDVSGAPKLYSGLSLPSLKYSHYRAPAKLNELLQGTLQVHDALNVLLFAKGSKWEATENGLRVTYDGGAATLSAKPSVKRIELERQADIFNSVSQAIGDVGTKRTNTSPSGAGKLRLPDSKSSFEDTTPGLIVPGQRAPSVLEKMR